MASRKRQDQNMEPASLWNERNDAHLLSIIEEKLISIKREIRDCRRPSERNRLKAKRAEYRDIYTKIKRGDYCGNIILNQFLDAQEASKLARMRQEEMRAQLEKELEKGKKEKKQSREEARREKFQEKQAKIAKRDAKFEAKYGQDAKKSKKEAAAEEVSEVKTAKVSRYVDAFSEVNFDYQGYFRKTRYYGILLPFISLILLIAIIGIFLSGVFVPAKNLESIEYTTGLHLGNILTFKLGPDELDYRVPNDGNWPTGTWKATREKPQLPIGKLYEEESFEEGHSVMITPEKVYLYEDLGMTSVTITTLDVLKAFFYTPLMAKPRVDFIEDLSLVKNKTCWYHIKFMRDSDRIEAITIQRQADGTYDASTILRWLATYGTIFCLMAAILFFLICFIQTIVRFFTYTSRKLHLMTFLALLFSTLTVMLPALLVVDGISFSDWPETFEVLKESFSTYLVLDSHTFLGSVGTINVGLFPLISLGLLLGMLILPILFRNRLRLKPSYVPKGNKPHTFLKKETPTEIGSMIPAPQKPKSSGMAPIQLNPALLGGLMPAGAAAPAPAAPPTAQGGKALSKKDIKKAQAKMSKGK